MDENEQFTLSSPAFDDGGVIPDLYTCKGMNISPPLTIDGVPEGTESLALVVHDPDAPGGDFLHWTVWNIDPNITDIDEDITPAEAHEGQNGFRQIGYGGPCPPSGVHHYQFDLYALDASLNLPIGASRQEVEAAIQGHAVNQTHLAGTVAA